MRGLAPSHSSGQRERGGLNPGPKADQVGRGQGMGGRVPKAGPHGAWLLRTAGPRDLPAALGRKPGSHGWTSAGHPGAGTPVGCAGAPGARGGCTLPFLVWTPRPCFKSRSPVGRFSFSFEPFEGQDWKVKASQLNDEVPGPVEISGIPDLMEKEPNVTRFDPEGPRAPCPPATTPACVSPSAPAPQEALFQGPRGLQQPPGPRAAACLPSPAVALSLSLRVPLSSGGKSRHLPYRPLTIWGHLASGLGFSESVSVSDVGGSKATCGRSLRTRGPGLEAALGAPLCRGGSPLPSRSRDGPSAHALGLSLPG